MMNAKKPDPNRPLSPEERELRNVYAGLALSGLIMSNDEATIDPDATADDAFDLADAMIKRSRK
jgi:hypothetical protein